MRPGKFQLKLAATVCCLLAINLATAFSQPATFPAPQIITSPGQPKSQDIFDNLIASASSFDMDSPVTAQGEFDPPVAVLGQRVVYRVEVSALDESLKMPDQLPSAAGLQFHPGGHGQTYQRTAAMKLQPRTTYLYHITATAAGIYTLPAFDVLAYGKPIKVPAASLTVTTNGSAAGKEPPGLLTELAPGNIYVGQLLRINLLLPDPGDGRVHGFNKSHIAGEFIFSEPAVMGMRRENIQRDGKSFPAFIEETMVTPLREGRQEIIAQAYAYVTRPLSGQPNIQTVVQSLIDSDPMTLNVKGLPEQGRLPGFTGAVGHFKVDPPRLATNNVRAGEPMTMTVTLRGDGNLGRLTPPPAPLLRDWQIFPPTGESIPPAFIQQRGFASFTYTMIPLNERIKATPALPFSCFDPLKNAYVNLAVPPVPLTVLPGLGETNAATAETEDTAGVEREPVLTGLTAAPGFPSAGLVPVQQRAWFLLLQLVPVAALGGLWFWDSRRRFHALHPEVMLKRRARRGLRRQLRLARAAAASGDIAAFATGAANALREACAPHSAANPGALVCADVLRELPESETSQGEIVRRFFAAADSLRFGGLDRNGKDLLALQPDLERLLEKMKKRL